MKSGSPIIFNVEGVEFETATPEWYPKPIERKILFKDPASGALHVVIRYPAGLNAPAHRHNCAHTMFVLDGAILINHERYGPGTYAHFPAGESMIHTTPEDSTCTILLIFERSPEFIVEGGPTYKIS
jgi:quercetin dioxygenase-like cupin family protein